MTVLHFEPRALSGAAVSVVGDSRHQGIVFFAREWSHLGQRLEQRRTSQPAIPERTVGSIHVEILSRLIVLANRLILLRPSSNVPQERRQGAFDPREGCGRPLGHGSGGDFRPAGRRSRTSASLDIVRSTHKNQIFTLNIWV